MKKNKENPISKMSKKDVKQKSKNFLRPLRIDRSFMSFHYTMEMGIFNLIVIIAASFIAGFLIRDMMPSGSQSLPSKEVLAEDVAAVESHWFELHRKSNKEFLYFGVPGDKDKSNLIREFTVKTGVPGKKPTPLPQLLGREYWVVMAKMDSSYDPETSPYFLTLDVPITDQAPYGPSGYSECDGQCNWELPGYFGLHGVGGNPAKLGNEDPGSSGCIRHSDEDITYLYNLLNPTLEEIRYYIKDI